MDQDGQLDNNNSKTEIQTSKEPPSAAFFKQNKFNIRALNKGIGEWGLRTLSSISKDKLQDNLFVVMGTLEQHKKEKSPPPPMISRFPWEGFEEVGFRTVINASSKK